VIGVMIFFIVTAVRGKTSSSTDLDAFKRDFGPFLQALSFIPNASYLDMSLALVDNYPDFFLSYLAVAMAYRTQNMIDNATSYLEQARDKGDSDPFSALLPTQSEWDDQYPPQTLIQLNDHIWTVPYFYTVDPTQHFSVSETGYLILLSNGSTVYLNPVPLNSDVQAALPQNPSFLVEQTKQHYRFLNQTQALFPMAVSYGVEAQKDYPATAGLKWTGFLDDNQPLFEDFTQLTLQGQDDDECALFHIPSKTVFLADLLMYSLVSNSTGGNFVPGTWNNQTSFFMRLYYWTYGAYDTLAVPDYQQPWGLITNASVFSDSVRKLEDNDIRQIFLANGGIIVESAKSSLVNAFQPYLV